MLVGFAVVDAGLVDVVLVRRPRFRARLALVLVARITLAWCRRAPSAKTAGQFAFVRDDGEQEVPSQCSARPACMTEGAPRPKQEKATARARGISGTSHRTQGIESGAPEQSPMPKLL